MRRSSLLGLALLLVLVGLGLSLWQIGRRGVDQTGAGFEGVQSPGSGVDGRVLLIGLDGADWQIIDPLIREGRLPNLERLIASGTRANLLSISPMLSPVVWTTVATGVEPTRHGILDFVVPAADGTRQPVTSAQRLAPTLWEILSREGIDVGVVGWWASWPAEAVRGYLVSDRIAYQLFGFRADPDDARGKTWPPDLYDEIRGLIVPPTSIGWDRVRPYLGGGRVAEGQYDPEERKMLDDFRTLIASGETYRAIARTLSTRFRPRLEVVYFEGTDTVGHLFMRYRPPRMAGVEDAAAESFSAVVDRYYETADGYIGELLEQRDESWTVMIVSDHGFASDATRPRTTDPRIGHGPAADWHRRFGVLIVSGRGARRGAVLQEATMYDIAPTILALLDQAVPRSWPGQVLEQALDEAFLAAHPVRLRDDEPSAPSRTAVGPLVDQAGSDLLEKLRSLGYIASDTEQSAPATARNNAGLSLMAQGRYADAEEEFRAALADRPRATVFLVNLAIALRYQGRTEEATELLARALAEPVRSPAWRVAGNQLAQLKLAASELGEAERLVRDVLQEEPDAAEARNTLGLILEQRGDRPGAEDQFRTAARLDPHAAMARNNLGNLKKGQGLLAEAETWYLRAIEADPYFVGAYNNLALVYQEQGQLQRAVDLYDRALGKSPEHAVVLNNLGSLYFDMGEGERAHELWTRAARADAAYASPLNNLAGLAIQAGRHDEAEPLLLRALELDPDYGDARINLAHVFGARGELEAAGEALRKATLDPRSGVLPWTQLGLLELQRGRLDSAGDAWKGALDRSPRSVEALNGLGETYRRQGRRAEALELWRQSLTIAPDQPRLRNALQQLEQGSTNGVRE